MKKLEKPPEEEEYEYPGETDFTTAEYEYEMPGEGYDYNIEMEMPGEGYYDAQQYEQGKSYHLCFFIRCFMSGYNE